MNSIEIARTCVHYGLHIGGPFLLAFLFQKDRRLKAALIMLATMAIDLDHLLADPIFDPNRMSVGFHPLHSYPCIAIYVVLCLLPYEKLRWPWWLRAIGLGLVFHILTDLQDYYLWMG
mgnify:CR=1 FL=1